VGGERAETYLRLLAEAQLRAAQRAPGPDSEVSGGPRPARVPYRVIQDSLQQLRWAGGVLTAAGALDHQDAALIAAELETALAVRSDLDSPRIMRRLDRPDTPGDEPSLRQPAAQPMRIMPIGQAVWIANDRAPSELHLMTLVSTPADTVLTTAMRMHWPPDGSSTDLEITGAGPQHLPYDQLWAADDQGGRYSVGFDGDGGTAAWHGVIRLSPPLHPDAGWLDLIADGEHRLIRLRLRPQAGTTVPAGTTAPAKAVSSGPVTVAPAERWLAGHAERIMARAWDAAASVADLRLGETVRILTDAGALAADSATPGQLAALCERLSLPGHGIAGPAAARIPVPWASVVSQGRRQAMASRRDGGLGPAAPGCEMFCSLGVVLPDVDGTRFALAGLASTAENSYLHVVASGLRERTGRQMRPGWRPGDRETGFSWWLRDSAGNWHVATAGEQSTLSPGVAVFRLRLIPPLAGPPSGIEVTVTGAANRVRAIVGCPAGPGTAGESGPGTAGDLGRGMPEALGPEMPENLGLGLPETWAGECRRLGPGNAGDLGRGMLEALGPEMPET